MPLELDGLGDAAGRFEQVERDVAADVGPLVDAGRRAAAEQVAEDAVAENIAEGVEDVVDVA